MTYVDSLYSKIYLLSAYHVPNTVLGAGNTSVELKDVDPALFLVSYSPAGGR